MTVAERVEAVYELTLHKLGLLLHPLFLAIVYCTAREIIIIGGWRAGKSTVSAAFVFVRAQLPGVKLVWILGPDYSQARQEFRYIFAWAMKLGMVQLDGLRQPADGSMSLTLRNGCRIETKSAQHPERLGSVAPDIILMAEPGQQSEETYIMAVGRLAERRGLLIMAGTLEDDEGHPRWAWYEEKAQEWLLNTEGSEQRAFRWPSWLNTFIYPQGEEDAEIQRMKGLFSEFTFARRIAATPTGAENPCFPALWAPDAERTFLRPLRPLIAERNYGGWENGAHGADYGTTEDHPCVHGTVMRSGWGEYWVTGAWFKVGASLDDWDDAADSAAQEWRVTQGRTDPNEDVLAKRLGYEKALGGASGTGVPSQMRIGLAAPLIEKRQLFFASDMPGVKEVFRSMRSMHYRKNAQGKLEFFRNPGTWSNAEQRYTKSVGDDGGQMVLYALEQLIGYPALERSDPHAHGLGRQSNDTAPRGFEKARKTARPEYAMGGV